MDPDYDERRQSRQKSSAKKPFGKKNGNQKSDPDRQKMEEDVKRNDQSEKPDERCSVGVGHGEGIGKKFGQPQNEIIP